MEVNICTMIWVSLFLGITKQHVSSSSSEAPTRNLFKKHDGMFYASTSRAVLSSFYNILQIFMESPWNRCAILVKVPCGLLLVSNLKQPTTICTGKKLCLSCGGGRGDGGRRGEGGGGWGLRLKGNLSHPRGMQESLNFWNSLGFHTSFM